MNNVKKYKFVSSVAIAIAVVLVIVVNVFVSVLNNKLPLKIDLTSNKMYELSDKTKEYLKNYDTPVDIYILAGESEQDGNIRTVLDKYATANKNINVTNINMTSNPTFGKKYVTDGKSLQSNSVIVDGGDKFKTYTMTELYGVNAQTGQYTSLNVENKTSIRLNGKNTIYSGEKGEYSGKYKMFGIVPIKNTKVKVVDKRKVYPVGLPVGLYLKTQGVMIIDDGQVISKNGEKLCPAKGLVKKGDYITEFNGKTVSNKSQLSYLINENKEKIVTLTVKNNNITKKISIKPVSDKNGNYMLGIWVRDDSQGIGTVTFITKDNKYCALGHGISDIDTGELLSSNNGTIFKANIWGIRKGESGKPGGLCGSIEYNNKNIIGDITKNCVCGLYGNMDKKIISGYNISEKEIGLQSEIKKGEASIQFIADGNVNIYKIEIENIYANAKEKNMVIKITDKRLLNKTGGIVQGMSGSPIIQNGKVIGAVTHVMINDPTRGYGILAENMLKSI